MVDVAIVGAGTSGAAAAALCAQRGLEVVCLDRAPLGSAGARWVNGVPKWSFQASGIDVPKDEELLAAPGEFHLVAGRGPARVVVRGHQVLEVDMRHLVARLQGLARQAGAKLLGETSVEGLDGPILATSEGPIEARWVVDAAGLKGPALLGQPRVAAEDLCVAAQEVREIVDEAAAREFFRRHDTPYGATLCFTGVAGGYSILNLRAHGDTVAILTGSVPALGYDSGVHILKEFAQSESWIGSTVFGGSRALPIRRSWDRLASDQVALIGDSGCQVFPAHGSGIGPGLAAARLLADALSEGGGPRAYEVAWMRKYGGRHAAYDLFRRFSQTLSVDDRTRLIGSGLLDERSARAGLDQRFPSLWNPAALRGLPRRAKVVLRERALVRRILPVAARMAAVLALYARYPRDRGALPRWSGAVANLFGEPAS